MNLKPIIYTRKSSDEDYRQVLSIDGQKDEMNTLALRNGLPQPTIIEETKTAFKSGRVLFNQMIAEIKAGKYNYLLCWKLDRLARNFEDSSQIIDLLISGKLQGIRTHDRLFLPADNVVVITIDFAMACQYSRDISTNVKRTNRKKLRDGIWPGRACFGYSNSPVERDIQVDPPRASIYRKAVDLYLSERYSFNDISRLLDDPAIGKWRRSFRRNRIRQRPLNLSNRLSSTQWHRILTSTFYYGIMEYCGELHPGKHEPLISKATFDRIQAIMRKRTARKGYTHKEFAFRKLLMCGQCKCTITLDIQKGIPYWRCTKRKGPCNQKYIHGTDVLCQIRALSEMITPSEEIPRLLQEICKEDSMANEVKVKAQIEQLQIQIEHHEASVLQLLDLLMKGTITEQEYRLKKNNLIKMITELRDSRDQLQGQDATRFEPLEQWISALSEALVLKSNFTEEHLRAFVEKLGSNHSLMNGQFSVKLQKRWKIWLEWKSRFGARFSKMPVGYQLSLLRTLRDKVRTAELECSLSNIVSF